MNEVKKVRKEVKATQKCLLSRSTKSWSKKIIHGYGHTISIGGAELCEFREEVTSLIMKCLLCHDAGSRLCLQDIPGY